MEIRLTPIYLAVALIVLVLPSTASASFKRAPNNLGLVGYWSFDDCRRDKASDSSGYGNTGTLTNFALSGSTSNYLSGSQAKRGCALNFDGTNDYVEIADSSSLDSAGGTSYSYGMWIKTTSAANTVLFEKGDNGFFMLQPNVGGADLYINTVDLVTGGWTPFRDGQWHHLFVVYNVSANTATLYKDGTSIAVVTSAGGSSANNSPLRIGSRGGSYPISGSLDDVRIYSRALSANEVSSLYNAYSAKVKAPNNTGLVGYWSFDDCRRDKASDSSGYGNTGTLTNFALSGSTSNYLSGSQAKRGCALNFDGTNDYVSIPYSANHSFGTGDFTLTAWIKGDTLGAHNRIIDNYRANVDGRRGYIFSLASGVLKGYIGSGGALVSGTATLKPGIWYHAVLVRSGDTARIYLNGVQDGAVTSGLAAYNATSDGVLDIGAETENGSFFSGSLDDVRIYSRALSANEVSSLYNAYSAKVKAPNNTGLVGYWSFDDCRRDKASDSSGYGNTGTLTNFALSGSTSNYISGSQAKRGCALNFDGTNDYVTTGAYVVSASTDPISYNIWFKRSADCSNYNVLIGHGRGNGAGGPFLMCGYPGRTNEISAYTVNTYIHSGVTTEANRWYMATLTFDGSTQRLYVNGAYTTSSSGVANDVNSNAFTIGGVWGTAQTYFYQGAIDEARVYNRALSAGEVQSLYNAYNPSQ